VVRPARERTAVRRARAPGSRPLSTGEGGGATRASRGRSLDWSRMYGRFSRLKEAFAGDCWGAIIAPFQGCFAVLGMSSRSSIPAIEPGAHRPRRPAEIGAFSLSTRLWAPAAGQCSMITGRPAVCCSPSRGMLAVSAGVPGRLRGRRRGPKPECIRTKTSRTWASRALHHKSFRDARHFSFGGLFKLRRLLGLEDFHRAVQASNPGGWVSCVRDATRPPPPPPRPRLA